MVIQMQCRCAFQLLQLTLFCSIEKIDLLSETAASYNYNSVATNKTRQAVIISRPGRPKAHQGSSDYFLSQKLKEGTSRQYVRSLQNMQIDDPKLIFSLIMLDLHTATNRSDFCHNSIKHTISKLIQKGPYYCCFWAHICPSFSFSIFSFFMTFLLLLFLFLFLISKL
jgi:hypothetical protein